MLSKVFSTKYNLNISLKKSFLKLNLTFLFEGIYRFLIVLLDKVACDMMLARMSFWIIESGITAGSHLLTLGHQSWLKNSNIAKRFMKSEFRTSPCHFFLKSASWWKWQQFWLLLHTLTSVHKYLFDEHLHSKLMLMRFCTIKVQNHFVTINWS